MKYSIGYNFNKKLINYFSKLNKKNNNLIFEVFFAVKGGYLGGARYYDLPKTSFEEAEKQVKLLKKNSFKINYLINTSYCPDLKNKKVETKVKEYFSWVESIKPDIVTVANEKIMFFLEKFFPSLKINASIVFGLKTVKQVNDLRKKHPNLARITLHQSVNRDKKLLIKQIKNAKSKKYTPVEIELLANEICLYMCPKMKEHYYYNGIKSFKGAKKHINVFESYCTKKRISNPIHFLNSTFIRPEDVSIYEKLGVDIIKLSGREAPSNYLKLISRAYLTKKYEGNVMNLFDARYWPDNNPPYIKNINLRIFLKYLWKNNLKKLERIPKKYLKMWTYK